MQNFRPSYENEKNALIKLFICVIKPFLLLLLLFVFQNHADKKSLHAESTNEKWSYSIWIIPELKTFIDSMHA